MTAPTPPTPPVILPPPPASDQFFCDSDGMRYDGVISIYGVDLPPGTGTVTRVEPDFSQFVVRGGQSIKTDYDFVLSDTEAPFDVPVRYILRLTPTNRRISHNWFLNPNFENANPLLTYATSANRTLTARSRNVAVPPYGTKFMAVSGYTGSPPIATTIPTPSRTNMMTQPSFENSGIGSTITSFVGNTGVATSIKGKDVIAPPGGGLLAMQVIYATAGWVAVAAALRPVPVVGRSHRISVYMRASGTITGLLSLRVQATYRDSSGAMVGGGGVYTSGAPVTATTGWQLMSCTLSAAPANAATIDFRFDAPSAQMPLTMQYDAIMVETVNSGTDPVQPYFDGDTPTSGTTGHKWTGAAKTSTSIEGRLYPAGTTAQRLLTYTKPAAGLVFTVNTAYRVIGRVNVVPPLFSWAEVRSNPLSAAPIGGMTAPPARDWNDPMFDSGGHTWNEVLGFPSTNSPTTGTLFVGLCDATGALLPGTTLHQAAVLNSSGTNDFIDFEAEFTTPATALTDVHIGLYQGDGTRIIIDPVTGAETRIPDFAEYQRQWMFEGLMLTKVHPTLAPLRYFDGSNDLYVRFPGAGYGRNEFDFLTFGWDSGDSSVVWSGEPNNSDSIFTGASVLGAYTGFCTLAPRESINGHNICEPVFLSDPIIPSLSEWVGLLSIGPLTWAPRRELVDVLGRHAPVALSQFRATPSAEFRFMTNTLEERTQFITIINSGRIILLRNPDPAYPETMWYISIGDVSEERIDPDHRNPIRRWVVVAQVVDRPSGLLTALNGQNWQSVRDTYTDWTDVQTDNDSWLNVLIGPAVLGTAFPGKDVTPIGTGRTPTVLAAEAPAWSPVP